MYFFFEFTKYFYNHPLNQYYVLPGEDIEIRGVLRL